MKTLTTILLLFFSTTISFSQDSIRIYGHVTDFNNHPLDSVSVRLKNKQFEDLYETMTDKDGFFSLTVSKGSYYCLYAIKLSEWLKTKLEYWTWNVPAYADLEINPQYERMEIYGINAFEPQVGPWDTYMIYFRPMSLTKILDFIQNEDKIKMESLANANHDTTNVAPSTISMDELEVSINEIKAEIKSISRVLEYARGGYLYGYVAQVKKPEDTKVILNNYDKISIVLKSKETGESGKGEYFLEKKNY